MKVLVTLNPLLIWSSEQITHDVLPFAASSTAVPPRSDDSSPREYSAWAVRSTHHNTSTTPSAQGAVSDHTKLFTPEELSVLPAGLLDRHKLKQQTKKAKKRRQAAERTEGDLMLDFMGMVVEEPVPDNQTRAKLSSRSVKKAKKAKKANNEAKLNKALDMEVDEDIRKERDFANFLATIGGEHHPIILT